MKKILSILLIGLLVLIAFTGCGKAPGNPDAAEEPTGEPSGNAYEWSEDRKLTPGELEIFNQALEGRAAVAYEPTLVATQVVLEGNKNYRFTAEAPPAGPGEETDPVYVFIFKSQDEPPILVNSVKIGWEPGAAADEHVECDCIEDIETSDSIPALA